MRRCRLRAVDVAFGLLAIGWLLHVLWITRDFSFWSDDLFLIEQAGSPGGLFEPYNDHMSLVILSIYRASATLGGFTYTPFMVAGALSLAAVPVSYYVTTRSSFGPPLAAILAMPLLWYDGMNLRPSGLNHSLALVGGIVCAAALRRGPRADGVLAGALLLSLCSAGGGVVVAGACIVHNLLLRPPLRRWIATLVPTALWVGWWLLVGDGTRRAAFPLGAADAAREVWDLSTSPFYAVAYGHRWLAYVLMAAFVVHGARQLRAGLHVGANFLAWSAATVGWAVGLVQSRGAFAGVGEFRYTYLALGFVLLAAVPGEPIGWPARMALTSRRRLGAAAVVVLGLGAASGMAARGSLRDFADFHAARGREADGTLVVLGLGPGVIPDRTPLSFFGIFTRYGTAGRVRAMTDRYGSPFETTPETADRQLVDLAVVDGQVVDKGPHLGCTPLSGPLRDPGVVDGGAPVRADPPEVAPDRSPLELWAAVPFTVEIRRFADEWTWIAEVPAGRTVVLTLPALNADHPWEIRAGGACDVSQVDER